MGSLIWYANALRAQIDVFQTVQFNSQAVASVLLGVALYPVIYAAGAVIWMCALRALGFTLPLPVAISICAVAQFGKYLPGNFAHHLGRVVLSKRHGAPTRRVVVSMVIETVNLIVCGFFIAALALLEREGLPPQIHQFLPSSLQLLITAASAAAIAAVAVQVLNSKRQRAAQVQAVESRWLPMCVLVQSLIFLLHGVIASVLLIGVFGMEHVSLTFVSGLFAVAWVAGFVTPGAPAGIGIREAVITLGVGPIYGTGVAVGLAAMLRIVSTLGDGLTFTMGCVITRCRRHTQLTATNRSAVEQS